MVLIITSELRMILIITLAGLNVTKYFNRRGLPGQASCRAYCWGAIGDDRSSLLVSHDFALLCSGLEAISPGSLAGCAS